MVNGTFTPYSDAGVTVNSLTIRMVGNIVTICGFVKMNVVNGVNDIGTIGGIPKPVDNVRTICTIAQEAYNNGTQCYLIVDKASNKITINSTVAGLKSVYFSVTYCCV